MRCSDLRRQGAQNPPGRYVYVYFTVGWPDNVIDFKFLCFFSCCILGTNHGQTYCQDNVIRLQNG